MIEVALATADDFDKPPPYRCRAYAVKKDGRVVGIGGLGFPQGGPVWMWAEITDELRAHPVALHKVGKRVVADAEAMGIRRMYATTAMGFDAAERWIKRLGFTEAAETVEGKKVHVWHAP